MKKIIALFKTPLLLALLISSVGGANTQTTKAPANYFLFILANWSDPAFNKEARSLAESIPAEKGKWNVFLLDKNYPLDRHQTSLKTVIQKALISARQGDVVWLEILGHGSNIKNADGIFYIETLATANNLSVKYPYLDKDLTSLQLDLMGSHTIDVHMNRPNGPQKISSRDIYELALDLGKRGINLTVLDHSCNGGATSMLLQTLEKKFGAETHLCTITSSGVFTPGKVDLLFSSFLKQLNKSGIDRSNITMNDYATYISKKYYEEHTTGSRLQSIGYKSGCNHTMALRDTLSLAASAYFSYWDWMRNRPSHVVRNPERYTYIDFDPRPVIPNNVRNNIPDGLLRWFQETNLKIYTEYATSPWAIEESKKTNPKHFNKSIHNSDLMYKVGLALYLKIINYRDKIANLDNQLAITPFTFRGFQIGNSFPYNIPTPREPMVMTVDNYLRTVFTKYCLCQDPVKAGPIVDCEQSFPPIDWNFAKNPQGLICKNPTFFRNFILEQTAMSNIFNEVIDAEKDVINFSAWNSKVIEKWERECLSPDCAAIKP